MGFVIFVGHSHFSKVWLIFSDHGIRMTNSVSGNGKGSMTTWQAYFEKAKENLILAQIGFEEKCFSASASRAYYAGFQAAIAALIKSNFPRGKFDHKWVQAEFSEKLIKRKKSIPTNSNLT